MISPISFTSTYKVQTNTVGDESQKIFKYYAAKMSKKDAIMETSEKRTPSSYYSAIYLTVADKDDFSVENFCNQNGIKYIKK